MEAFIAWKQLSYWSLVLQLKIYNIPLPWKKMLSSKSESASFEKFQVQIKLNWGLKKLRSQATSKSLLYNSWKTEKMEQNSRRFSEKKHKMKVIKHHWNSLEANGNTFSFVTSQFPKKSCIFQHFCRMKNSEFSRNFLDWDDFEIFHLSTILYHIISFCA